jgi:hypothetical protein
MGQVARLKKSLLRLRLPGRLMFLFRVRVGLYAVLARIGARLDWIDLEEELADSAAQPAVRTAGLTGRILPAWSSSNWRPEDSQPSA